MNIHQFFLSNVVFFFTCLFLFPCFFTFSYSSLKSFLLITFSDYYILFIFEINYYIFSYLVKLTLSSTYNWFTCSSDKSGDILFYISLNFYSIVFRLSSIPLLLHDISSTFSKSERDLEDYYKKIITKNLFICSC